MRLHRLELAGFGPFRDRQFVDFDAFADDGIFLISGRTGAGKSSVLDGICFALYGGVPRYAGTDKRLRSDHCAPDDPTEAVVEFSTASGRWRVTRSPEYERPKRRGSGTTTEPHRAELHEYVDGVWVGRAARPVDVGRELDEILGLSQQQFLQVILLAQNRFAEFLLAKNDDRQTLLRKLFGTRTYEGYQQVLETRRRESERALAAAGDVVTLLLDEAETVLVDQSIMTAEEAGSDATTPERLDVIATGVQRARYRADTTARERDLADDAQRAAESALGAVRALRERQEQRMRSRDALAALERVDSAVAAEREVLRRAVAAEAVRAPLDTVDAATEDVAVCDAGLRHARGAWHEASGADGDVTAEGVTDASTPPHAAGVLDAGIESEAMRATIDTITGDLAVWAAAAEHEERLTRLAPEQRAREERIERAVQVLSELEEHRAAVPEQLRALDVRLAAAHDAAGALEGAQRRLAEARERRAAAAQTADLAADVDRADAAHVEASAHHSATQTAVTDLLRRRLAERAGELAAALIDGEPCVVCGATEHPAPAARGHEPVSDDVIAEAERLRDAAAEGEASAASRARAARAAHAAAAARAGGIDHAQATAVEAAAVIAHAEAEAAAALRDDLLAQRSGLERAADAAQQELDRLTAELAGERAQHAAADAQITAARDAIERARGGFPSVAARLDDARERRDRAIAYLDALRAAAAAASALARAEAELGTRLDAAGIDSADEARDALRSESERSAIDERIRAHDAAIRAERDRLRDLELELAGAPEELADVDGAASQLALARAAWRDGVVAAEEAAQLARRLDTLATRARDAFTAIDGIAADHAVLVRLADTIAGRPPNTLRMTLESFVLAAELEEIVEAANLRLGDMSAGRYRLQHTDARAARNASSGLGLEILDAHTGSARPAQSLSGGETFLASLALALGLAEVVTARAGGVQLDTLFIDEGFGALDDETLDLAMHTLDELRQGGRTVGLISHVAAMKEQLPAQLSVTASAQGPSIIAQAAAEPASRNAVRGGVAAVGSGQTP